MFCANLFRFFKGKKITLMIQKGQKQKNEVLNVKYLALK